MSKMFIYFLKLSICNHTHKAIRKAAKVFLNSQSLYEFGWLSKALRNIYIKKKLLKEKSLENKKEDSWAWYSQLILILVNLEFAKLCILLRLINDEKKLLNGANKILDLYRLIYNNMNYRSKHKRIEKKGRLLTTF